MNQERPSCGARKRATERPELGNIITYIERGGRGGNGRTGTIRSGHRPQLMKRGAVQDMMSHSLTHKVGRQKDVRNQSRRTRKGYREQILLDARVG